MNDTKKRQLAAENSQDRGNAKIISDIAAAKRVLTMEADGLSALAGALDHEFSQAVDLVLQSTRDPDFGDPDTGNPEPGKSATAGGGRVVLSGMGKSGHIARKIAGTFASTGTPALYVHPGEASHGDLGMVAVGDTLILLSNSGETPELGDMIAYAKRFAIPLIAMTSRADSSLAMAADIALVPPASPEACPMGLAPTTSTTVMLGLGDALAVALMERRGFSSDQFQMFHPGGKLGQRLVKVEDLMHSGENLPLAAVEDSMADVLLVMTTRSFGCAGVVDKISSPENSVDQSSVDDRASKLLGIITDGDLRRHMNDDLLGRTAREIMSADPKTIRPDALAAEAVGQMNRDKVTCLFVVEDGRPVGILHVHDCLRAGVV